MVAHREGKEDASNKSAEMERRTLHDVWSDGVTNAEIWHRTNTKDIVSAAHSLQWKWGGHVASMDQRRWAHAASIWGVRVGRGRTGKPKTPWQTRYREKQEETGDKKAKNKSEWSRQA
jgi:hypothetical protein